MGRRTAFALLAVALVAALAACGKSEPFSMQTGAITWKSCDDGMQCASLAVPLDRQRPGGEQVQLALARRPASGKSNGVLLTNPGGPGGSGVDLVRSARNVFPSEIRKHFDIVSWDPRGVGASAPVRCEDNLDVYYAVDRSPDTATEQQATVAATQAFVDACEKNSGNLLPHVSTEDTVRDMEAIRAALQVKKISYVGFSYGTLLGALYADQYPEHVRAMVLDGAVDPSLSFADATVQQAQGFDNTLNQFFAYCRTEGCGFAPGGDPAAAFDRLATSVDAEPVFAELDGERRTLGPGEFDIGVASGLYQGQPGWKNLGQALAETATGLGSRLLELSDEYTGRKPGGDYSNSTAAFSAIGCLDSAAPPTIAGVEQLATRSANVAPRFGASTAYLGLSCTLWPVKPTPVPGDLRAKGAPPIVVVSTTNDPATPYRWGQALSQQLDTGNLVTVEGAAHTGYGRGNDCVDNAVDDYLLDLAVPAAGLRC